MRHKIIYWTVIKQADQLRLDRALALCEEIPSRSQAAQWIRSGRVRVNGSSQKSSFVVREGDKVEIQVSAQSSAELIPLPAELDIVFEDENLLVLNKPAGLVVHPAAGHQQDTLVNMLIHHIPGLASRFPNARPGLVHRLDKDTSGLMVIAKDPQTAEHLSQQFKSRTVKRRYWAIVRGIIRPTEGTIRTQLARHPHHRKKFASTTRLNIGKLAVTHYKTLKTLARDYSLIECRLETGRTHQIRVHLSEAGSPIVGDVLYAHKKSMAKDRGERLALHAFELGFIHPHGQNMYFKVDWPTDLQALVRDLKWS